MTREYGIAKYIYIYVPGHSLTLERCSMASKTSGLWAFQSPLMAIREPLSGCHKQPSKVIMTNRFGVERVSAPIN